MYRVSLLVLVLTLGLPVNGALPEIYKTKVEYLSQPWGVDTQSPRFSWLVSEQTRGTFQVSEHVCVTFLAELCDSHVHLGRRALLKVASLPCIRYRPRMP